MSQGFICFALDTETTAYSRLSYALALSIKIHQPSGLNNFSVITNNPKAFDDFRFRRAIDNVIPYTGPIGMDARSRISKLTPYDRTMFLDCDMLVSGDVSYKWDLLKNKSLYVSNSAQDFQGNRLPKYGPYRKVFNDYKLPDLYSAFTYFNKASPTAKEFFNLVEIMTDNPQAFIKTFLANSGLRSLPTDEAFALAAKILDIDHLIGNGRTPIIHLKSRLQQGWDDGDWTDNLKLNIDDSGYVLLGTNLQLGLVHYVDKNAISDPALTKLEMIAYG